MAVDANSDETGALTRNGIIHSGILSLARPLMIVDGLQNRWSAGVVNGSRIPTVWAVDADTLQSSIMKPTISDLWLHNR